jgi:hypothetical protein
MPMIGAGAKIVQQIKPVQAGAFPLGYEPEVMVNCQHELSNYNAVNQRYILGNCESTQSFGTSDVWAGNISSCFPRDVTIKDLVMDIRENSVNTTQTFRIYVNGSIPTQDQPTISALQTGQLISSVNLDIDASSGFMTSLDMGANQSQNSFDHNSAMLTGVLR